MSYSPAVAKILIEKYGFVTQPDGAVVSPTGYTRNEAGETVKYTAPAADPVTPAAPVVAADPVTAALDPVTPASASMDDVKQDSVNQLMALANQTAASNQQLRDQLGFGAGAGALPPEPELTSIQKVAQALQNKIDEVGVSTFSRSSDDDRAIRFADGTNLLDKDILAEFGVGRNEFLDAIDDLGVGRRNLFRTSGSTSEAGAFKQGLENILLSPEERAIKEQEYKASAAEADRLKGKEDKQFEQDQADRAAKKAGTDPYSMEAKRMFPNLSLEDAVQALNNVDPAERFKNSLAAAKDDLVTRGGQLGGDLKDLASSVGGGITDLVDQGKQFLGITAPGAVLSSSAPPARPAGLDNFGYDEDGEVFDSAIYNTTPNIFGEVGRGSGYNIPTSVGGGSSDDVYQDAILRGGGGSSLGPAAVGTDDRGFTSGVLPSSVLGEVVGADLGDNPFSPNYGFGAGKFLQENDSEWFEDWNRRRLEAVYAGGGLDGDANLRFMDELQGRFDTFLTGERGGRGPTVTVAGSEGLDGYQGLAYDELGSSPGDLAAIGGDVVTLGEGMGEGQDQMYYDGTTPVAIGGGGDDTSLNEGQGDIFTNIDPVTYDPITGGDDSGGGGAAGDDDSGGGASGGGDQGGGDGGGGGSDPVDPGPVDLDPVDLDPVDPDPDPDSDDPVGYDPLVPFIPSNIQVPSFLQPSLVPYSGNTYAAPSMDFIRANQVNPFADPYANVFVARNGGIVSLR